MLDQTQINNIAIEAEAMIVGNNVEFAIAHIESFNLSPDDEINVLDALSRLIGQVF